MAEISVVIPVYNVEKYLERCLDSVVNQTFKDIEIICVNDCSPDNSLEILKKYQKSDERINIINRGERGGLSAARNTGFEKVCGEYVYFLDSDDWIAPDYLEKMLDAVKTNKLEAVCNTNIISINENGEESKLLKRDFEEGFVPYSKACMMAWSWMIKKSYLDKFDVIFPNGLKYEDNWFFYVLIRELDNVYVINSSPYYHFENQASIMGAAKGRVIKDFDIIKVLELVYENYKKENKLDKWSIPFFYMPKYMLNIHENKKEFFDKLKDFYNIIKKDVSDNKHLYSDLELNFLNEIVNSESYDKYKGLNTSIIGALRQNIRKNNAGTN